MRMIVITNKASRLLSLGYDKACKQDDGLAFFFHCGGADSVDVLKATLALAKTPKGKKNPVMPEDIFELYHVHNKTKKCEKAKA